MPIYAYTCPKCDETFDHLARRMDEAAPACPKCGHSKTAKALTAPAIGASAQSSSASLPMGGVGGCCPCGKNQGSCSRG